MNPVLFSRAGLRKELARAIEAKNVAYSNGDSDKVRQAKTWIADLEREMSKRGM